MKHYGDINLLKGDELPVVDVIVGGSPCQDLSVAGKRAGLAGERSGLFMEQIRIVKEMREKDGRSGSLFDGQGSFPMIWENINGKGTALWSSEIDKHAVAVCKFHFPEEAEE